ncbi:hypothetical protein WALSEDRAFT_61229 [Wallemia mellicola CBS 633.66]|uniref:PH domain-containing protein n=1 Tax=Wallemia mellicola (strain ATCC MYA-4683 / CBS 633.66) TaxID=671144 RepID=I4Y7C6_WALMC|nr:hypothetical protein WALSEDRAFT_61229 [Wallemia mellicola CBS 633.66]EIM19868.1 hypothetical protein WALSEDRAFT_61229 [Wallemia mellicola CBS 633.66]TIB92246.1 hypothetical protein E3Q19_02023 [Wallemia mellicola]TIC73938.1 hypothetical protein E3Q00_02397 [Wallemia mellicola]|eukprot:XP_006960010.1 hypothetical protein WALSEDRAFT_61229 [Wallemia mellicola CBS 633.66]
MAESTKSSKSKLLAQKQSSPSELVPSDILLDRFNAWKTITKNLIAYFEGIADIESNTARELTKLGGVIQVPFKEGSQFMGHGGLQDIFFEVRDKSRSIADHHANLAKTIDGSIVQHLHKLRAEIKAHIRNIANDTSKLATSVAREREYSMRTVSDLQKAITTTKNTPTSITAREDPYLMNSLVAKQLQKQVQEENALQKSIIIMQQNSAQFEEGITSSLQSAWSTFDEWQSRMSFDVQESWKGMGQMFSALEPDAEWLAFADRTDHLLDPETPLRQQELIDYPGRDDPSVLAVHVGWLERKKRFTKSYKEGFYVLTPAGYLHEFNTPDPTSQSTPTLSLFLPNCTLGPPSHSNTAKSHKFHLEANKANKFSRDHSYTFRARSHETMSEWWNDLRMLVSRYLVASETMDRSGPIAAAVRSAGYISESEEEGGSSLEEDEEEEEEEETFSETYENQPTEAEQAQLQKAKEDEEQAKVNLDHEPESEEEEEEEEGEEEEEAAPAYSSPRESSGIQIGKDGYAVDKKPSIKVGRKSSKRSSKGNKPAKLVTGDLDKKESAEPDTGGSPGLLNKFKEAFVKSTDHSAEPQAEKVDVAAPTQTATAA